jgi:hypothetical protein
MFSPRALTRNQARAADVECGVRAHTKLGAWLLAAVVVAGACSSTTAGRVSLTATKGPNTSLDSSDEIQTSSMFQIVTGVPRVPDAWMRRSALARSGPFQAPARLGSVV